MCFDEQKLNGSFMINKMPGKQVLREISLMKWKHGVEIKIVKGEGRLGTFRGTSSTFTLQHNSAYNDVESKISEIQTQINQCLSEMNITNDDHCTLYTYPTDSSYIPLHVQAFIW